MNLRTMKKIYLVNVSETYLGIGAIAVKATSPYYFRFGIFFTFWSRTNHRKLRQGDVSGRGTCQKLGHRGPRVGGPGITPLDSKNAECCNGSANTKSVKNIQPVQWHFSRFTCISKTKGKTRRALGGAHVPPTELFPRLAVNNTILKSRIGAATGTQNVGFSSHNKIPHCSAYDIGESNPVPASRL